LISAYNQTKTSLIFIPGIIDSIIWRKEGNDISDLRIDNSNKKQANVKENIE